MPESLWKTRLFTLATKRPVDKSIETKPFKMNDL